jgi:outer membrane protein
MIRSLALFFIAVALLFSCSDGEPPKTVFINNVKVFESFQMKKDYDSKLQEDLKQEATILDSLELRTNQYPSDSLETFRIRNQYMQIQQVYNQKFEAYSAQYTTEVNNRLNEYIEKYSKEKGYDMVLGSGGEGNIMYVRDGLDITDDLITYINKLYSE